MHVDPLSPEANRKAMLALKILIRIILGGPMSAEEIRLRREIDPIGFMELFEQPDRKEVLSKFENADEAIDRALDELEEEDKRMVNEVRGVPVAVPATWQANTQLAIDHLIAEMERRAAEAPTRPRGPRL